MVKTVVELNDKQKLLFSNMRACYYDVVCYLDIDNIINIINTLNVYKYAVSPLHDLDKKGNGEFKKPHYHLVLCFGTKKRGTSLVRLFNTTEIRVINNTAQLKGSFEYLTHNSYNCEKKVKYEKSKLITNDLSYFEQLDNALGVDNSFDIIDKIILGVSIRELVKCYGKDFVYHYNQYNAIAELIMEEDKAKNKRLLLTPCCNEDTGEIEQIKFF